MILRKIKIFQKLYKKLLTNTNKQQANNTRRNHLIKYNGKTQTVSQWANELGVEPDSIFNRLQKGFTEEEALTLKFNERRKRC